MTRLVALDTETTGLDPRVHVPWEVATVDIATGEEQVWRWRPHSFDLRGADREARTINGFNDRAPVVHDADHERDRAADICQYLDGAVIVGSKPSFDVEMLTRWLRSWGYEPTWHHRPVCVATMAYGWLHGYYGSARQLTDEHGNDAWVSIDLPWKSDDLSTWCGVKPPSDDERHTALGDARWVARWYRHLTGGA